LDASVRGKFQELWREARRRFVMIWRNGLLTAEAKSIDDMIRMLPSAADELDQMRKDGVTLDDDCATLVTTDPKVAEKYGMVEESEYWAGNEEKDDEEPSDPPAP
jgi:hypothetical protein